MTIGHFLSHSYSLCIIWYEICPDQITFPRTSFPHLMHRSIFGEGVGFTIGLVSDDGGGVLGGSDRWI